MNLGLGVAALDRVLSGLARTTDHPDSDRAGHHDRTISSVIAGSPVMGSAAGRVEDRNPARLEDVVANVELGDASTFVAAARAGRAAQPVGRRTGAVRGRAIAHIGRVVEANAERLAQLVTREVGKPFAEALGEVREIVDTCDFFLGEGRRLYGQTVPSELPDKPFPFTFRNSGWRLGDQQRPETSRSPSRPGISCRRCCVATPSSGSRRTTHRPAPTRCTSCSSVAAACPTACSTS